MDLMHHLNLINNHGYNGYIATYTGANQINIFNGDIVLVKNQSEPSPNDCMQSEIEWRREHVTTEKPMTQDRIEIELGRGSNIKTLCTCVGVPQRFLDRIYT